MYELTVKRLLLAETGRYNTEYARPYITHTNEDCLLAFENRVDNFTGNKMAGEKVTESVFSGIASQLLQPSATPTGVVDIPNGWAEQRCRFFAEVACRVHGLSEFTYFIQGFTDHLGLSSVSGTAAIDPNMRFYVNSMFRVSPSMVMTRNGAQQAMSAVTDSTYIIGGQHMGVDNHANGHNLYGLRPYDMYLGMEGRYLKEGYDGMGYPVGMTDTRLNIGVVPTQASRNDNIPSRFLSNFVNSTLEANLLASYGQDSKDVLSRSRSMTAPQSLFENPFMKLLFGASDNGTQTVFKWSDIVIAAPEVRKNTAVIRIGDTKKDIHDPTGMEYWNGADFETQFAKLICNALPTIMMDAGLSGIDFTVTNMTVNGLAQTTVTSGRNIGYADPTSFHRFALILESSLMTDISRGNMIKYTVSGQADLFGDLILTVSVEGSPYIRYHTPLFADSLTAPTHTPNLAHFYHVVDGIEEVAGRISSFGTSANMVLNDI